MAKGLKDIDSAAASKGSGIKTLWQFVKFIFVSLIAFVIQTFLPYAITPFMSNDFLTRPYEWFIYSSEAFAKADMADHAGLGLFIAFVSSNILAQIVSFFINKDKTFNSDANTKVVLPIYLVVTVFLIAFSAWLQPYLVSVLNPKIGEASIGLSGAICGAVQFFIYFPVDKLLFPEKKEEKAE